MVKNKTKQNKKEQNRTAKQLPVFVDNTRNEIQYLPPKMNILIRRYFYTGLPLPLYNVIISSLESSSQSASKFFIYIFVLFHLS